MSTNVDPESLAVAHPLADTPGEMLSRLWCAAGGDPHALDRVSLAGAPVLPSVFRVGDVAVTTIAASGLAAAELWRLRTGRAQDVAVDMRHAEVAFLSERYLRVDGEWPDHRSPTWGYYRARDRRWVQLHTTFAHHRDGAAALLGAEPTRAAFEAAIAGWDGQALEDAFAARGLPASLMRSRAEWSAHDHGAAVAALPLMDVVRIGDAPPRRWPAGARPLAGMRVLDLTRVIAGPVCGRTLAEHGAEVMRVAAPRLPFVPRLVIDTGRGKLSTHLDLAEAPDRARFERLLEDAHVLVQGYRPGAIAGLGYAPEAVAERRPGIVYVSLCAYGHAGPWAARRGFDSLVQVASGIAQAGTHAAGADDPRPLPCQALDHATGYLAAFGATLALLRQRAQGGSWHVRVSLAQTAEWLQRLGMLDGLDRETPAPEAIADLMDDADSPFGCTRVVRPAAGLSETPAHWSRPAVPLGTHPPEWPR